VRDDIILAVPKIETPINQFRERRTAQGKQNSDSVRRQIVVDTTTLIRSSNAKNLGNARRRFCRYCCLVKVRGHSCLELAEPKAPTTRQHYCAC
jgi:hypothetical protein